MSREVAAKGRAAEESDDENMDCRFSDWEEEEGEEETYQISSLITPSAVPLPSVRALVEHERSTAQFDLRAVVFSKCGWGEDIDEIVVIKLVNYIRAFVQRSGPESSVSVLVDNLMRSLELDDFLDDRYMMPTLSGDVLLFLLPEFVQNTEYEGSASGAVPPPMTTPAASEVDEVGALRQRIKDCEALIRTLTADDGQGETSVKLSGDDEKVCLGTDTGYFGSYSHLDIHEVMLNDKHRTNSYAAAIAENANFIEDKIVLDVGCGSGILSMLAARAGAKLVIGIDVSDIVGKTRIVVRRNGYESVITIVQGKIEECVHEILLLLPKDGKVDCIVSEWMGYGLYYENMFASVIFARDKFLRDGGLMLPSRALLFVEAMTTQSVEDDRVAQWNDMYGFDMQDLTELFTRDAQVQIVSPAEDIISKRVLVHELNLHTATDAELDFDVNFKLPIRCDAETKAICITFDTIFSAPSDKKEITLTTAVQTVPTHWKHTVLWLAAENRFSVSVGDEITGKLSYARSKEHRRDYIMSISFDRLHSGNTSGSEPQFRREQLFQLAS